MDDNGDKTLSLGEFKKALSSLGLVANENQARLLFEHFDADNRLRAHHIPRALCSDNPVHVHALMRRCPPLTPADPSFLLTSSPIPRSPRPSASISFDEFLSVVRPPLSERRHAAVRRAFAKVRGLSNPYLIPI